MGKFEIEEQIRQLQNNLTNENDNSSKFQTQFGHLNEFLRQLASVSENIDKSADDAMRTINRRLDALRPGSQFAVRYRQEAKSLVWGDKYKDLKDIVYGAESFVQKRIAEWEQKINNVKNTISTIQQKIDSLKNQIMELGE